MSKALPTAARGRLLLRLSNLKSFIAQLLVKYNLPSCKKLKWLVDGDVGSWCSHASGQSCALTQEITGKYSLLMIRVPHLALLKDRKTLLPWSCAISRSPMNSLQMKDSLSWRTGVRVSPCKKQQHITWHTQVIAVPLSTPACLLASHVFRVTPSVSLPVMKSSEAESHLGELTSHVIGAWHIDELSWFAPSLWAWLRSLSAPDCPGLQWTLMSGEVRSQCFS